MKKFGMFALLFLITVLFMMDCTAKTSEFVFTPSSPAASLMPEILPEVSLQGSKLEILSSLSKAGYKYSIPSEYFLAFYFPAKNQELKGVPAQVAAGADKEIGYRCSHASDVHLCRAFTHWYNAVDQYYGVDQGLPDQFTLALQNPKDQTHENYIRLTENYLRLNPSSYYSGQWPYVEVTLFGQTWKFRVDEMQETEVGEKKIGVLCRKEEISPNDTKDKGKDSIEKLRSKIAASLGDGTRIESNEPFVGMTVWQAGDKIVRLAWKGSDRNSTGWISISIEALNTSKPQNQRENMIRCMEKILTGDIKVRN